jgi:hypothetical protein
MRRLHERPCGTCVALMMKQRKSFNKIAMLNNLPLKVALRKRYKILDEIVLASNLMHVLLHRGIFSGCAHETNTGNTNLKMVEKSNLILVKPFTDDCAVHVSLLMRRHKKVLIKLRC